MEENETRQNNIGSMSTGSIAAKICSIYNIYLICTMATCIKDSYSTIPEKNRPYAYLDTSIKKIIKWEDSLRYLALEISSPTFFTHAMVHVNLLDACGVWAYICS